MCVQGRSQDLSFGLRLEPGTGSTVDVAPGHDRTGDLTGDLIACRVAGGADEPGARVGGADADHDPRPRLARQDPLLDRTTRLTVLGIQKVQGERPDELCGGPAVQPVPLRVEQLVDVGQSRGEDHGSVVAPHLARRLPAPHDPAVLGHPAHRELSGQSDIGVEHTQHDVPVARVSHPQEQAGIGDHLVGGVTQEVGHGRRHVFQARDRLQLEDVVHVEQQRSYLTVRLGSPVHVATPPPSRR